MSRKRFVWCSLLVLAGASTPLACSGGEVWQGGGRNYNVTLSTDAGTNTQPDTGKGDSSTFDAPVDTGAFFDVITDAKSGN